MATASSHLFRILTLDPVHIGIGQDIMGEVDLPIDREEETRVPRFPGSALKGAFRAHANRWLRLAGVKTGTCPGDTAGDEASDPSTAGGGGSATSCGVTNCPVCQTFGWPSYKKDGGSEGEPGREGRVFFRDARLAFFPAMTNHGTLWFSTPGRAAAYLGLGSQLADKYNNPLLDIIPESLQFSSSPTGRAVSPAYTSLVAGWLEISDLPHGTPEKDDDPKKDDDPAHLIVATLQKVNNTDFLAPWWPSVAARTILLDETTFYRLVESSLERRTCNRIDELTGTVADKALFSYEALPRQCLLYSRLEVEDDGFAVDGYSSPLEVCDLARDGLARLGIGGLQTRGLGGILVEPLVLEGD